MVSKLSWDVSPSLVSSSSASSSSSVSSSASSFSSSSSSSSATPPLDQDGGGGQTTLLPSSAPGRSASLPISIVTLLDNLTNPHRRLDRTQSEPSKTPGINVNTSRYKTELCRPFEESGMCKYGDKCQFAHGEHELRGLVRHPKYKTELCRTFHTVGFCPYGPRCHFIHNADEARGSGSGSGKGSVTPPPAYSFGCHQTPPNSPPPPPVSPDSRLPVFNRISAPFTSYPLCLSELIA
ncbi:hypothetical protein AAG570_008590 [Ranatra chinensis]|uniref:C3H1-type domain-containing protein n=1 Tax=Ranatra chinensis TaxID=642074 RepID=A0ABD0YRE7_9HEMI